MEDLEISDLSDGDAEVTAACMASKARKERIAMAARAAAIAAAAPGAVTRASAAPGVGGGAQIFQKAAASPAASSRPGSAASASRGDVDMAGTEEDPLDDLLDVDETDDMDESSKQGGVPVTNPNSDDETEGGMSGGIAGSVASTPARGDGAMATGEEDTKQAQELEVISREFTSLRDRLFGERIAALEREIEAIKSSTHPLLGAMAAELEAQMKERIWSVEEWKKLQVENAEGIFKQEREAAEAEYKAEVEQLRDRMVMRAMEKKRRLNEEKAVLVLANPADSQRTRPRRNAKDTAPPGGAAVPKRKNLHPSYSLTTTEIHHDMQAIHQAIAALPIPAAAAATNKDVYVDAGALSCFGSLMQRGSHVLVELSKKDSWEGVLVDVNGAVATVRRLEGQLTRERIPLSLLRSKAIRLSLVVPPEPTHSQTPPPAFSSSL